MICPRCGFESWYRAAACPNCYEPWELMQSVSAEGSDASEPEREGRPVPLAAWEPAPLDAVRTHTPFDLIAHGRGVPVGAVLLLYGAPGAGKSTLGVWLADAWPRGEAWYFPFEIGIARLKREWERLGGRRAIYPSVGTPFLGVYAPGSLLVVDSLHAMVEQRLDGDAERLVPAVRRFRTLAEEAHVTVLLVSHVTKRGAPGGPETVRHDVDVSIEVTRDAPDTARLACAMKNRFGPPWTAEVHPWPLSSVSCPWPSPM